MSHRHLCMSHAAAMPPPDFELQEVELEVEQEEPATTQQPPTCTGVALKCHSCNFTTHTLRPSKAKQRLASHVHSGNCTTDTGEEHVNEITHGDRMPSSMVSYQVLSYEDPREERVNEVSNDVGMQSPMVSHQVPIYEDPCQGVHCTLYSSLQMLVKV